MKATRAMKRLRDLDAAKGIMVYCTTFCDLERWLSG